MKFIENLMTKKETFSILFLISMLLFIISTLCNEANNLSAEYLSSAASILAAFITYKVSLSAEKTSEQALEMNERLLNREVLKEGPFLRIITQEIIPTGIDQNLEIKNIGETAAFNISSNFFKIQNTEPLMPYNNTPGMQTQIIKYFLKDNITFPKDNSSEEYFIKYEDSSGRIFKNIFILQEENINKNNTIVQSRISVYRIVSQKRILEN